MLIYNTQKKLVGIDASDLKALGFTTLADLTSEVHDFADLFVKKPGFIHNFKHVNWIDFVACIDIPENAKVIIHANAKDFQCTLSIGTIYLAEEPESKAFTITLRNLQELSSNEPLAISMEDVTKSFTQSIQNTLAQEPPMPIPETTKEELPTEEALELEFSDTFSDTLEEDLKIDIEEEVEEKVLEIDEVLQTSELYDNGYIYDPQVASDALGLPVDLIEEFIGDFIAQAKEFKDNLYTALKENDTSTVQILSHKLKGVAANLRIEDALESLTIINTSKENASIAENLDTFYKIIAKLSGEKTTIIQNKPQDIELDFKEDAPQDAMIAPQKIDTPLLDDAFELDFKVDEEPPAEDPIVVAPPKYDRDLVALEIGIDKESFDELFEDYIDETKRLIDAIEKAIELQNTSKWQHKAQQLRGMSDSMRMLLFHTELETLSHTDDAQVAQALNEKIKQTLTQISQTKE